MASQEEKKALEKLLRQKDAGLLELTEENGQLKERLVTTETEFQSAQRRIRVLEDEKQRMSDQNEAIIKRLAVTVNGPDPKQVEAAHFAEVSKLVSELQLKSSECEKLSSDVKMMERLMKGKDSVIARMERDTFDDRARSDRLLELENQVRDLTKQLETVTEENKTLLKVQRIKTSALDTLAEQLKSKDDSEEKVKELGNQMRLKDKEIMNLQEEKKMLERVIDRKDAEILKLQNSSSSSGEIRSLESEKRVLQADVKKYQEKIVIHERTIKAQLTRIHGLQARLDSVVAALKDNRNLAALEAVRAVSAAQNSSSASGKAPRSPEGASRGSLLLPRSPAAQSEESVEASGELETGLVSGEELVPAVLLEALQKDIDTLRTVIRDKETLLADKDQTLETLEKKLEIANKAKQSEAKKLQRTISELSAQLDSPSLGGATLSGSSTPGRPSSSGGFGSPAIIRKSISGGGGLKQ